MPDGLAAFIAERLDEAEAAAKAASSEHLCPEARDGRWQVVGKRNVAYRNASEIITAIDVTGGTGLWYEQVSVKGDPDMAVADYIAANDPARTLRGIAGKRKILAEHNAVIRLAELTGQELGFLGWYREWVLKNLAAEWADHPAYQPEWAPQPAAGLRPESSPATIPPAMPRLTPT